MYLIITKAMIIPAIFHRKLMTSLGKVSSSVARPCKYFVQRRKNCAAKVFKAQVTHVKTILVAISYLWLYSINNRDKIFSGVETFN